MREIIFRGKNVDNGAWVYGSFIPDMLEVFCITDIDGFIKPFSLNKEELTEVRVERSTVGQYTELCDKNGTKIFEGDILSAHLDNAYPEDETLLEVIWHNNGWYGKNEPFFEDFDNGFEKYFEVIGNIHDNPELLQN